MNNIQDNILKKIKAGEVDMKPKWHFMLRTGMLVFGVIVVALLSIYLLSFLFFFMNQSGLTQAFGFGFRGISFFVMSSPWLLIGASAGFLVLLYFLVKQYSFSYRRPLVYSMVGVVFLVLLGSWFIQTTMTHHKVGSFLERHEVPVFSPMYRGATQERPEGMTVGVVTELTDAGFLLESEQGEILTIVVTPETRMRPGAELVLGERAAVFGDRVENTITAFGVKLVGDKKFDQLRKPPRGGGQFNQPPFEQSDRKK